MSNIKECDCDCHAWLREAAERSTQARKRGEFYYYHMDCYCCTKAILLDFYLPSNKESNDDKGE
jgi:hypothetical protein